MMIHRTLLLTIAVALLIGCSSATPSPTPTIAPAVPSPSPDAAPPVLTPVAPAPSQSPAAPETLGPVETILAYYNAISQHEYDQAYALWADQGAASGQTLEQFQQGYADTAGINIQLDQPNAEGDGVNVPIRLIAVQNLANNEQRAQYFTGSYHLTPSSTSTTGWEIASASIAEGGSSAPIENEVNAVRFVLNTYYTAINNRNYPLAYTLWDTLGTASGQSYAEFAQGYAATTQVSIELGEPTVEGAAGSLYADVPIVIWANSSDQGWQVFCGSYALRRANVPPFDQFGWHLDSATINQIANTEPSREQISSWLDNGCSAS